MKGGAYVKQIDGALTRVAFTASSHDAATPESAPTEATAAAPPASEPAEDEKQREPRKGSRSPKSKES